VKVDYVIFAFCLQHLNVCWLVVQRQRNLLVVAVILQALQQSQPTAATAELQQSVETSSTHQQAKLPQGS
jgi:hypothetical protein